MQDPEVLNTMPKRLKFPYVLYYYKCSHGKFCSIIYKVIVIIGTEDEQSIRE